MLPKTPLQASARRSLLALVVAALPVLAFAAVDDASQKVDRELQTLKDESLRLARDLQLIEQALLYPDQSRTTLYVSNKVGGFLLDEIVVRINEDEPLTHKYTDAEARALLKDGWHRLHRRKLDPGTYRLRVEFTGHFFDARASEPPIKGKLETLMEKGLSEVDWVIPIARNTRLDKPGLSEISRLESRKLRPARNVFIPQPQRFDATLDETAIGTLNDPRYRSALFLRHDNRYLSALTELLDIVENAPTGEKAPPLPGALSLLLAECYLGFGMQAQASALYQKLADDEDPVIIAKAQLQLAQFDYQRGYYNDALARLNGVREKLPGGLLETWRILTLETLLAQQRYNEAITLLSKVAEDDDDLAPILRYNLAVALIRDGRGAEGRKQLNLVGTMDVTNLDTLVLRDKANVMLGYEYLKLQQGANAKTLFGRVRTTGPFSNRALLGLGWAEVAPVTAKASPPVEAEGRNTDDSLGTMLRPGYVDPKARERLNLKPGASQLSTEEQEALIRALTPWTELVKRDPMDPAVQEGMLAIPWALDRLHAYEQSLTKYLDAIAALETARKRMDEAMKSIRQGRMVETLVRRDADSERGWMWRVTELPDAPETYFLQSLLAEHRFQESLKNYRDARLLARYFESWKTRLAGLGQAPARGNTVTQRQLARARQTFRPTWAGTVVWLDLETALGTPGAYDAPLPDVPEPPLDLRTLDPPVAFEGVLERLAPLRQRIEQLTPKLTAAVTAQDNALEAVSLHELQGQKKTIERYLTEARFAVARIYDRQLGK